MICIRVEVAWYQHYKNGDSYEVRANVTIKHTPSEGFEQAIREAVNFINNNVFEAKGNAHWVSYGYIDAPQGSLPEVLARA